MVDYISRARPGCIPYTLIACRLIHPPYLLYVLGTLLLFDSSSVLVLQIGATCYWFQCRRILILPTLFALRETRANGYLHILGRLLVIYSKMAILEFVLKP